MSKPCRHGPGSPRAVRALGPTLTGIALLALAPPLAAQSTGFPTNAQELGFYAADSDGDGRVTLEELARDAAAGFAGLDRDGSRTLTAAEVGPDGAAAFARVDADKDGVLTFIEVMDHKAAAFTRADRDGDAGLTYDEMVSGVAAELEGTP